MIRLDDHFIFPGEGSDKLGYVLAELLARRWASYRKALKRCRRKFSEKSVHALRVEVRRMLAALALLGALLPSDEIEALEGELKQRLKALSRLRDTHVQIEAVSKMLERDADLQAFHDWLQRRERRYIKRLEPELEQSRTGKATRLVGRLMSHLQTIEQQEASPDTKAVLVRATGRAFQNVLARCRHISATHIAAIHRTRVAFKKFRYMVESLAEVLPGIPDRQVRAMQKYQTRMGKIQDAEVLLARAEKFARRNPTVQIDPLRRRLTQRRARLVREFVATANQLLDFWPPASFRSYGSRKKLVSQALRR
jgi:CHAD domain-containing protein